MKKLAVMALVAGMAMMAQAGTFKVQIRMPDQTVLTFELPSIPKPDSDGNYHFFVRGRTNKLIVHVSNVWIEEMSKK